MSDAKTGDTSVTELRDLLTDRIGLKWDEFSREHPGLAASIDRVQLIESTVTRLADDPQYQRAMELAGQDEALLGASAEVVAIVEVWARRALALGI